MAQKLKVLFVASEGVPFAKTGGLADVVGTLPYALQELGVEVKVLLGDGRGSRRAVFRCLLADACA